MIRDPASTPRTPRYDDDMLVFDAKKLPGPPGMSNLLAAPIDPDGAPRTVGPFAVVVHTNMAAIPPGVLPVDADVRPHPHIGLAATSFLVQGSVTHRDSLGNRRELRPGDLGATVSGRGLVHSERFERIRVHGGPFEMFQLLIALPNDFEDGDPSFLYRAHEEMTVEGGVRWLLPAPPAAPGGMPGTTPLLLADVSLDGEWTPPEVPERAIYVRSGVVEIGDQRAGVGQTIVLPPGPVTVRATSPAELLAFGGTNVGPRYLWWNYMHSSVDRIEAAKAEWRAGRVKLPDGDTESFTPCPADDGRPLWRLNRLDAR